MNVQEIIEILEKMREVFLDPKYKDEPVGFCFAYSRVIGMGQLWVSDQDLTKIGLRKPNDNNYGVYWYHAFDKGSRVQQIDDTIKIWRSKL